jgi:predicted membrane-bound spermidine synthase
MVRLTRRRFQQLGMIVVTSASDYVFPLAFGCLDDATEIVMFGLLVTPYL